MRSRLLKKLKQNNAFTMMEMLITVAVIVVLLGISILGISQLVTSLKMAELDDYAKTIYLEAQNQLTAKEVEGGIEAYYERFEENYTARFLQVMPQDYDVENNGEEWRQLCYITKNDEITETLIAKTSNIYQTQGDYVIELNPQTGDIYGVFYWEKEDAISYSDIINLVDRSRQERTDMQIGYYGGAINGTMSTRVSLDQQVELINEETLTLKVSYDASARLRRYYASSLKIQYYISNEDGTVIWPGEIDLNTMVDTGDRLEFSLLLDSMIEGSEFKNITAGSGLIPGENLSIVVRSTYEHGSDFCIESNDDQPVLGNSLYGNQTASDTIEILNLRHFRNLDENYTGSGLYSRENGEALTIEIANDIDFADNGYLSAITPIFNGAILSNSTVTGRVNDENYVLKNFVIRPKDENGTDENIGLFANANNVVFTNIMIEDITVDAKETSNVGALVGSMTGGSVEKCGVYLTTSPEDNDTEIYYSQQADSTGTYKNEMEYRYNTRKITGANNVGGLIGVCDGTQIENSFAAIQVVAEGNKAGGFVGGVSGSKIENSYASGDVTGSSTIGGFAGSAANITITEAYSAGNVYGESDFGGFLGESANSVYESCNSYGEVLKKGMTLLDGVAAGGFIYLESSSKDSFVDCKYLNQSGFNKMGLSDPTAIGTSGYKAFVAAAGENILSVGGSFPYKATLFQTSYPFKKLPNQEQHYGNWPAQYVIDTALVYYEKYADGSYGYYGVTYITDDSNLWLLNTLLEETCVEDGYALLTKYNLDSFNYDLYVGSGSEATASDVSLEIINEDSIQSGTDAAGKVVRLVQQGNIEFAAYTSYDTVTGKVSGKTGESFLVNGMYLYQLPYDLQCTDRYGIDNFYDRFVIKDVIAKGSTKIVIDEMSFFYCPHFAKTAVNPDLNSLAETPTSIWNPQYVSVRSARQLNALGRYPYYWNARGGNNTEMYFIQETDINFSSYTNGTKLYCGQDFDLLAFKTEYANKPIGQTYREDLTASEGYGEDYSYAQFSNNYNGNSYQIIDYCVESNLMFVGLFGEIMDATIENVVMTISDEAASEDYTGNAGKIISTHVAVGDATGRTGIGGLVGMSYLENNSITNCAIAGYDVELHLGADHIGRLAVGGLVGFSMSSISNCSAVNDVRIVLLTDSSGNNASAFLAGLSGSFLYGSLENCYSGGTIDIVDGDGNGYYKIGHVTVGGITAGGLYTPNNYSGYSEKTDEADKTSWSNLYTYTQILTDKRDSNGTDITKVFSAYTRYYRDPNGVDIFLSDETAIGESGENCYYLDTAYEGIEITNRVWFGVSRYDLDKSVSLDYTGLSSLNVGNLTNRVAGKENTYPTSSDLDNVKYPFPAVVTNVRTKAYVHYGDWPVNEQRVTESYPLYFEQYGVDDFGIYYIQEDGSVVSTLVTDDSKDILRTGYGYMTIDDSQSENAVFSYEIQIETESLTYYAYALDYEELYAAAGTTSAVSANARQIIIPYNYKTVIVLDDEILGVEKSSQKSLYVNPNFAAAISLSSEDLGTEGNPLQVRTPAQFTSVGLVVGSDIYMIQTHSLDLAEGHTPITVNFSHVYNGGADSGFVIQNARNTIFETNNGTITKTVVTDSVINTQSNAAVFVNSNGGTISDAEVIGAQLTTSATGAGFVYNNSGTIQNAYVVSVEDYADVTISGYRAFGFVVENAGTISKSLIVGTVKGVSAAAGFAAQNTNTGIIRTSYANTRVSVTDAQAQAAGFLLAASSVVDNLKYCYATGDVEGYTVYGFMNSGNASWCYTISQLNGADMYGFAGDEAVVDTCYWAYNRRTGYNMAVYNRQKGKGTPIELFRLLGMNDYDGDVNPDSPFAESLGEEYPYPSVGLPHIGDWKSPF